MNKALKAAISSVGSINELARRLNVSRQVIQQWKKNNIPPHWVLSVERETGVSRYDLRPDIYGKRTP